MRKTLREIIQHLLQEHTEPGRLGAAVGLGVFVGCLPLYGLHLPICIFIAWVLGLNKVSMYLAAQISNPLFAPFLIAAALVLGEWMRFGQWRSYDVEAGRALLDHTAFWSGQLPDMFLSTMIGGAVMGVVLGAVLGPLTWLWAKRRAARKGADR